MFDAGADMSPALRETEFEGQDQMLFSVFKRGEVFGHEPHIFPGRRVLAPFTIKTNEKTRLLVIEKEAVDKYCAKILRGQFDVKYDFLQQLRQLGKTRDSFDRMLPLVSIAKHRTVPKQSIIVSQGEAKEHIFFVKQGQVKLLKELEFIRPDFAAQLDTSSR